MTTAFDAVPRNVMIPTEFGPTLDGVLPPESSKTSIRVVALNNPSYVTTFTGPTGTSAINAEISQTQGDVRFDIPCAQSVGTHIDTRLSTLEFTATFACTTSATNAPATAHLRSSAYAYFDTLRVYSGTGGVVEEIPEWGLTMDTLLLTQMDFSSRVNAALLYGFDAPSTDLGCNGHNIGAITDATSGDTQTFSYSLPLVSAVLGQSSSRFLPVGLLKKLQLLLQTSNILPITIKSNSSGSSTGGTWTCTLTNFSLRLEMVDIGASAMNEILKSTRDGLLYYHGISYKTANISLPSGTSGSNYLPVGLTGSSVKSLFVRFYENGTPSTNTSCNGKYSSKNPLLSAFGFNISGRNYPESGFVNPLLNPSQSFRDLMIASGSFNSTQYKTSILPANYCILGQGGTSSGYSSTTQDARYATADSPTAPANFLLGLDLEKVARRGVLNGRDLQLQKLNLVLQPASAVTNTHTCYVSAMHDIVIIINPSSAEMISII